jgi:hypothetical protein
MALDDVESGTARLMTGSGEGGTRANVYRSERNRKGIVNIILLFEMEAASSKEKRKTNR